MSDIIKLSKYYNYHSISWFYELVRGVVRNGKFFVQNNDSFRLPIRDRNRKILGSYEVGKDSMKGQVFKKWNGKDFDNTWWIRKSDSK